MSEPLFPLSGDQLELPANFTPLSPDDAETISRKRALADKLTSAYKGLLALNINLRTVVERNLEANALTEANPAFPAGATEAVNFMLVRLSSPYGNDETDIARLEPLANRYCEMLEQECRSAKISSRLEAASASLSTLHTHFRSVVKQSLPVSAFIEANPAFPAEVDEAVDFLLAQLRPSYRNDGLDIAETEPFAARYCEMLEQEFLRAKQTTPLFIDHAEDASRKLALIEKLETAYMAFVATHDRFCAVAARQPVTEHGQPQYTKEPMPALPTAITEAFEFFMVRLRSPYRTDETGIAEVEPYARRYIELLDFDRLFIESNVIPTLICEYEEGYGIHERGSSEGMFAEDLIPLTEEWLRLREELASLEGEAERFCEQTHTVLPEELMRILDCARTLDKHFDENHMAANPYDVINNSIQIKGLSQEMIYFSEWARETAIPAFETYLYRVQTKRLKDMAADLHANHPLSPLAIRFAVDCRALLTSSVAPTAAQLGALSTTGLHVQESLRGSELRFEVPQLSERLNQVKASMLMVSVHERGVADEVDVSDLIDNEELIHVAGGLEL